MQAPFRREPSPAHPLRLGEAHIIHLLDQWQPERATGLPDLAQIGFALARPDLDRDDNRPLDAADHHKDARAAWRSIQP